MKIKSSILIASLLLILTSSCSKDDGQDIVPEFVIAFENKDTSFSESENVKEINLVFSEAAIENGSVTVKITETGVVYNTDYTINSTVETNQFIIPFKQGDLAVKFTVNKLQNAVEGELKILNFELQSASYSNTIFQGNNKFTLNFTEVATLGAVISPEIGGANQPNQVYVDLSLQNQTKVKRDSWDLGFYAGDEFSVQINGSIFMGAAQLDATSLNDISENDVTDLKALIATNTADTDLYFDDPSGDITKTAIGEISSIITENKVYLLKLGYEVSEANAQIGSVALSGELRGWKKIRVFLNKLDNYVLQYADLNDTSFKEIEIAKQKDYNFTFFSFNTESILNIEPIKEAWDLKFTVFTNILDFGEGVLGGYGFSDFITINNHGGVTAYEVFTEDFLYKDFELTNVDFSDFSINQTTIGDKWRSVFTKLTLDDRFFVLKDIEDHIYKIRFNALVNENGERGYPSFDYVKISD